MQYDIISKSYPTDLSEQNKACEGEPIECGTTLELRNTPKFDADLRELEWCPSN